MASLRCISFRCIDPSKLQSDAVLDSNDEEVRHIPHHSEVSLPQSVNVVAEVIAEWLQEAYNPSLMKTKTHTGYVSGATTRPSFQNEAACIDKAHESGRPLQTLARTQSTAPSLELQAKPFFERSAIFLRLKVASKWGRGYGSHSQPFMAQDLQCWRRIKDYDWGLIIDDDVDILVFVNHWFDCDFTWDTLAQMFSLDVGGSYFEALISGSAQIWHSVSDCCAGDAHVRVEWQCGVCEEDGKPTLNTAEVPAIYSQSDEGPFRHDFCSACRTYRHDKSVWLCRGPPARTWPRTRAAPCLRAMQMLKSKVGVPCCAACETVRHDVRDEAVFKQFSNSEDEPVPENTYRAE